MTHFLIVGLGSIGRRHATNLKRKYPDARFTIVRHRSERDDLTRQLDARVVGDLADAIDDDVDLAVLSTPSANHMDALPMLIDRAWPLLVEKPIATAAADCDRVIAQLGSAAPAVRVAGFNLRYLPSLRRMKQLLDSGELGTLTRASFIAGQWLPDWRPGVDYRNSYSADARRGGGVELDLSHEFDVARWFFGEQQVAFATGGRLSELELMSNDTSISVLAPAGGRAPLVTVSLDYVARQRVRWYEIVGDRGRLEWNIDGALALMDEAGRHSLTGDPIDFDVGQTYVTMLEAVMAAIDSGDTAAVQTLSDGVASTRLALDVRDQGGGS